MNLMDFIEHEEYVVIDTDSDCYWAIMQTEKGLYIVTDNHIEKIQKKDAYTLTASDGSCFNMKSKSKLTVDMIYRWNRFMNKNVICKYQNISEVYHK